MGSRFSLLSLYTQRAVVNSILCLIKFDKFTDEIAELSQLILCSSQEELIETLQFNINSLSDRKRLLIHLHKKIKPPNYTPANRLEQLITQAIKYQIITSKCHMNSDLKEFPTLQEDYIPPKPVLPVVKKQTLSDPEDEVWFCRLSPSDTLLASVSANKRLILYSSTSSQPNWTKKWQTESIHGKDVTDVIFSHDEARIITSSKDKSIKLWNVSDGKLISHIEDAHQDFAMSLCRLENTKDFMSGGIDGNIICWDYNGNKKYSTKSLRIKHIACSKDGKRLFAASGLKNIVIYDTETREEVGLIYEADEIISMCVGKNSYRLATNTSTHSPVS